MSDSVKQYQHAFASLTEAEQRATTIVASIRSLAATVGDDWKRLKVAGAKGIPDTLTLTPNAPSISSDDWPSFSEFRDAISAYHESSLALKNLWINMPSALRSPP
jgi:hypothetical protein